ncbi:hypothetical protein [Clostridium sp. OS1-26]|uniref:P-type ATPase n=1 Tax=Clostridium sp. OS1-26 TaxID=3070681 RepID=UPI0035A92F51
MSKISKKGFIENLLVIFCKNTLERKEKKQSHDLNSLDNSVVRLLDKKGNIKTVNACRLKKGDIVVVEVGDIIPSDGEVIEGLALVDESAITGESVPVMKEVGGDSCSVISGTRLVSNWLKIKVVKPPVESCLDKTFYSTERNAI